MTAIKKTAAAFMREIGEWSRVQRRSGLRYMLFSSVSDQLFRMDIHPYV